MISIRTVALAMALVFAPAAYAAGPPAGFTYGPVIEHYGPVAAVPGAEALPANAHFKVVFDVSEAAAAGEVNGGLESVARFINMHARAGIPVANMQLAIVVRSGAVRDLTAHPQAGHDNPNAPLIAALIANHVDIYACGQAAAHANIHASDLLPGVKLALSAMTEFALLQQQGYTLNP
jgi:intracellular sulfur oxidation DsrE/DsrF family protein